MYETQFGLNKRPFRALATGADVFVGPQTVAAMAGLKKALASPEAVVAVGGPVGVGKTTVVRRALSAIGDNPIIICVGRMHLGNDEVLELLLEETGVDCPPGTVQRFTRFRRQLKQYADNGSRVFVVVEDASRVGADALSELEALTATDAGVSEGASIVLMGDEGLDAALKNPQLARLRQRLRLRQSIEPLSSPELLGYLKHCFRLAGNEFDQVFENGSAEVLHGLSEGIPRVANNLVESSLISAAENKLNRVSVEQIKRVASEEYDLSIAGLSEPPSAPVAEANVARPVDSTPESPPPQQPAMAAVAPAAERPVPAAEPGRPAEPSPAKAAEDEVPDLIQDTLPDLEILAPDLARPAEEQPVQRTVQPQAEPQPEQAPPVSKEPEPPVLEPQPEQVPPVSIQPEPPVLEPQPVQKPAVATKPAPPVPEPQPAPVSTASHEQEKAAAPSEAEDEIPEWDRDPTLAQLRPDLDALEQALAVDEGEAPEPEVEIPERDAVEEEVPEVMPEITLDRRIKAKVDEAEEQIRQEQKRRAEAEAEKQKKKEAGVDKRTTAEILADAGVRDPDPEPTPDDTAKEQVSAKPPAPEAPVATKDLHATSDTVHELPVLIDATEPAFEPSKYRKPEPKPASESKAIPEPEDKPAPANEINLELESEPEPAPEPKPSPEELEKARKADAELEQIASNLARAKTIDDCDDKMAETLFGEEFSMMAAQVAASAPPELLEDDEQQEPEISLETEALDEPQRPEESANDEVADPAFAAPQDFEGAAAINVELEADSVITGSADTSASQRLQTVRALNAGSPGATSTTPAAEPDEPKPPVAQPESIEDQINTSMTQTMKTLSIPPVANDDDDDGKSKRGFFSRFRR